MWVCQDDKCLFLGDMFDLFAATYGIDAYGIVTSAEQELYVLFTEAHCSKKARIQAQEKGLCKSASVRFHLQYSVNSDMPLNAGGLHRDNSWWIHANESENRKEFNGHYDTRGRGKFTTGQDILELLNKRTYNPVTTNQDKYELGYGLGDDDDGENIISRLWFHPNGSTVGNLNWMHTQVHDSWWTDRGFLELT